MMLTVRTACYLLNGITRTGIRIIFEILHRLLINLFDTLFGFLNWPRKKLRIRIIILRDINGDAVCENAELDASLEYAKEIFRKNFNVTLLPDSNREFTEILKTIPPVEVLYTRGGTGALKEEFSTTGSFFAANLRGSFYPVTAFVVINIKGALGCSLGPISDYVTLDLRGTKSNSTLAHELAHACGLWHSAMKSNLLYRYNDRGDDITWWQRNLFRSSRHVTYW